MDDFITPSLMQLLGQAPVLIAYLVGVILAFVFWKQYPFPCLLTLIATSLLLLTTVAITFVQTYLIHAIAELGWSSAQYGQTMSLIAIIGSFLRAAAFGLLLTAIFSGRSRRLPVTVKAPEIE